MDLKYLVEVLGYGLIWMQGRPRRQKRPGLQGTLDVRRRPRNRMGTGRRAAGEPNKFSIQFGRLVGLIAAMEGRQGSGARPAGGVSVDASEVRVLLWLTPSWAPAKMPHPSWRSRWSPTWSRVAPIASLM